MLVEYDLLNEVVPSSISSLQRCRGQRFPEWIVKGKDDTLAQHPR
jgi:hypothetical protein